MRLLVAVLSAAALLSAAVPASAATVSADPDLGYVTYTAGPGEDNDLTVDRTDEAFVYTDAPSVAVVAVAPCEQGDQPNVARCPLTSVTTFELGDLDDAVDLDDLDSGGFVLYGEEGGDTFTGSSGRASTTMIGGPGTDTYVNGTGGFDAVGYDDRSEGVVASLDGVANDPDDEDVPADIDGLFGGAGDDVISGSDETDFLGGGEGEDTVRGEGGADDLQGGPGDDRLEGGGGNDRFRSVDRGADDVSGGEGFDRFEVSVAVVRPPRPGDDPDVTITLDDRANDGAAGEGDNVRSDVEDLAPDFSAGFNLRFAFTGSGRFNVLTGGAQADRLDGGPGSDRLVGLGGDDTLTARDGVMDRVDCGDGSDTAVVDALDDVQGCETVDRAEAPPGMQPGPAPPDDRPPTVAFAAPGEDERLGAPATVRVDAGDDRGVRRVLLLDDERVVATDETAPYELPYAPTGEDVGRNALVAVAVDTAEQTATAVRPVRVRRFLPAVGRSVRRARDRRAPFRFTISGALELPPGVTAAQACSEGRVSVQVKRRTRTISTRRVRLSRACAFTSRVTFRVPRLLGAGRLKATVRFLGNDVLRPRTARSLRLRAG